MNSNTTIYRGARKSKCMASTIDGFITSALTGCGSFGCEGPAGYVLGGTFSVIRGALLD